MHLLLVRHGETVDNVARLYAGSRDSALTNHGVLQAKRLGSHLASRQHVIGPITHIFTSNLQRAYKTAEAVAEAQRVSRSNTKEPAVNLEVVQLPELREKDFGSLEGKKVAAKEDDRDDDSESRDAMMVRVNRFIDIHLTPVLNKHVAENATVLIVSHGIVLHVLLRALSLRFSASLDDAMYGSGWSNTGVLQGTIVQTANTVTVDTESTSSTKSVLGQSPNTSQPAPKQLDSRRFIFAVQFTNNVDHLSDLKKTRGGIGSAKFDPRQRTIASFFTSTSKKRKSDQAGID